MSKKKKVDYLCRVCTTCFASQQDLVEHFELHHLQEGLLLWDTVGTVGNTLADSAIDELSARLRDSEVSLRSALARIAEQNKFIEEAAKVTSNEVRVDKVSFLRNQAHYKQLVSLAGTFNIMLATFKETEKLLENAEFKETP